MAGIDYYIDQGITKMENFLWTSNNTKFKGLARIDIDENVPYIRNGSDYDDVLTDDRYDVSSFFYEPTERDMNMDSFDTTINLVFMINMEQFSQSEEELIYEAFEVVKKTGFRIDSIAKDVAALDDFNYQSRLTDTMRKFFVFRFTTNLDGILKPKQ
jgi:hypothetical protein